MSKYKQPREMVTKKKLPCFKCGEITEFVRTRIKHNDMMYRCLNCAYLV